MCAQILDQCEQPPPPPEDDCTFDFNQCLKSGGNEER